MGPDPVDVVDGDDVRMVQCRGRSRFLNKSLPAILAVHRVGAQHFDRNCAVETDVSCGVENAHPPLAQLLLDLIKGNGFTNHRFPRKQVWPGPLG